MFLVSQNIRWLPFPLANPPVWCYHKYPNPLLVSSRKFCVAPWASRAPKRSSWILQRSTDLMLKSASPYKTQPPETLGFHNGFLTFRDKYFDKYPFLPLHDKNCNHWGIKHLKNLNDAIVFAHKTTNMASLTDFLVYSCDHSLYFYHFVFEKDFSLLFLIP